MGENQTQKMRSIMCVLLAALAFAAALPSDQLAPDDEFVEAQGIVTTMLQGGKGAAACRDLASATRKEVKANIKTLQTALDDMPKGKACDSEGSTIIAKAKKGQTDAKFAATTADAALKKANDADIDFGSFKMKHLNAGDCNAFYGQDVFKNGVKALKKAKEGKKTADKGVQDAIKTLSDAKQTAFDMVRKCKCKVKQGLEKEHKKMNANAKAANTKAWTKARHLECVLDGTTTSSCTVSALPTVKAVKLGKDMDHVCFKEWAAPSGLLTSMTAGGGRKFKLIQLPKEKRNWATNTVSQRTWYLKNCAAVGAIPIGCGSGSYNCPGTQGSDKCMGMPSIWSCNMLKGVLKNTGFKDYGQGLAGYFTNGNFYSSGYFYTSGGQAQNGVEFSAVCGKYIGGHYTNANTWKAD